MTLKERFINLFLHPTEEYLDHEEAKMCEKIADDYAIEFANWIIDTDGKPIGEFTITELLETFKKEKGL